MDRKAFDKRIAILAVVLAPIALTYGCYLAVFTRVSYYSHYPSMELHGGASQWWELRSGENIEDGKIAPVFVRLGETVYFLPELTEAEANAYCRERGMNSHDVDPNTGLLRPDKAGRTTYWYARDYFKFEHGRLVGVFFSGHGPEVGVKREGPFRSAIMTREEAVELFGEPVRIEKYRTKANWVFR